MSPVSSPFFFTWGAQRDAQPLHLTGGSGAWFTTAGDGGAVERWLDLGSLAYQVNPGHGHPRLIEAVRRQAAELCVGYPSAVYPAKTRLAERLLELAPEGFSKVFFTLGGAEAVENAIKIARMATGRTKLVSRYRSYHGATLGALSLTGDWRRPPVEPGIWGVVRALDCYCDRCPFGQREATCARECATHIGDLLALEGPGSVAAVVLEPVPGASGVLVPPEGYWPRVREACDRHGVLLVADEVLTGFGRTGRVFAFEHFGASPDLITVGKALTGGYGTLGAVLVHERVARHFDEAFLYAGLTHYAHPLGCAAGLEALAVYEEEGLVGAAAELGPGLLHGLRSIRGAHPDLITHVRGLGLLAAVEVERPPEHGFWARLREGLRRRRVHVHVRARTGMILLAPPLCISEDDLAMGLGHLAEAVAESLSAG